MITFGIIPEANVRFINGDYLEFFPNNRHILELSVYIGKLKVKIKNISKIMYFIYYC